MIGATASSRGLGAFPEKIGFELAFFAFELLDFPLQRGDPLQGIVMAAFPIASLLTEFEIFSFETLVRGS
ncbi:MAG TPA: hypothetical protein VE779_14735 [Candidatus Angelobacter sp.]|nr:hypothetical protein [Candidatus Angelobacter sp.]